jgi:hypothetical protein
MKLIVATSAAVLAVGMFVGNCEIASAQSDRTLGINCTVAGHEHCGENGRMLGYSHHHWRHNYGAYAYAGHCRAVRQRFESPSGRIIYRSRQICG